MFNTPTTRMPNGVTNAAPWQTMAGAGRPDPTWSHQYVNDFDTYAAGDWTVTVVGTGSEVLTSANGGELLLTNSAAGTDAIYMQLKAAGFQLTPGKDAFFKFAGILADVLAEEFYAGLIAIDTTPLAPTDGVYIHKPSGASALTLVTAIGSVITTTPLPASTNLVAATAFEVGFHVDTQGNIEVFVNPGTGPNPADTTGQKAVGHVATLVGGGLTQALLSPSFGLLNASAVAHTLGVDYIVASVNR